MRNVTIRTKNGREIGFWKECTSRRAGIEERLREDFGPGVYKVCYKTTKMVGEGKEKRAVGRPVAELFYVEGPNGENPVGENKPVRALSGTGDDLLRHLINQNTEAVRALDQSIAVLIDDVETLKDSVREFLDEEEEPGALSGTEEEEPGDVGFMQKILDIAQRPEYSGLAADIMSTQDQDVLASKVQDFITKDPAKAVGLVMEFFKK